MTSLFLDRELLETLVAADHLAKFALKCASVCGIADVGSCELDNVFLDPQIFSLCQLRLIA